MKTRHQLIEASIASARAQLTALEMDVEMDEDVKRQAVEVELDLIDGLERHLLRK